MVGGRAVAAGDATRERRSCCCDGHRDAADNAVMVDAMVDASGGGVLRGMLQGRETPE